MRRRLSPLLLLGACALALARPASGAPRLKEPKLAMRANEIVVSSADYANTPPKELARIVREAADFHDPAPPPARDTPPRFYQFLRGEAFDSDLGYADVCRLLVSALAKKNLHNTSDDAKVDFVLRVSYGGRRWRDPLIRRGHLEWRHGLVPRIRGTALGAGTLWDDRAGGDEAALRQAEESLSDLEAPGAAEGLADRLIGGRSTDDYLLIVLDAFAVGQLRAEKEDAPRAWTTFIAAPRPAGRNLSHFAAVMIAKAAPWIGETAPGRLYFTDLEGRVHIGESTVVEDPKPEK
jgi:hypothetical protein